MTTTTSFMTVLLWVGTTTLTTRKIYLSGDKREKKLYLFLLIFIDTKLMINLC